MTPAHQTSRPAPVLGASTDVDDLHARSRRLTARHRHRHAIDLLWRAVALRPGDGAIHRSLGRAYQSAQLWPEAVAPLRVALALVPDDPTLQYELTASLLDADAPEEVAARLDRLTLIWPERAEVQALRASALVDMGDVAGALAALVRAAALAPERHPLPAFTGARPADLTIGAVRDPVDYCAQAGIATAAPPRGRRYVVCPLPRARVVGSYSLVLATDDTLLVDGIVFNPEGFRDRTLRYGTSEIYMSRRRYVARLGVETQVPGAHLLLGGHQNFGHWLLNCFGRLAYAEHIPALRALPAVVPRDLHPARRELLALAGYGPERLTEVDPGVITRFDLLWTPVTLFRVLTQPRRLMLHTACTHFISRLARRIASQRPRRLKRYYLTRPPSGHRRLANEAELLARLAPLGVEAIDPAALSMRDQIEAASSAELIMGTIGAGLYLAFFAAPGTTVVQFAAPDTPINSLPMICRQLGQPFHEIACTRVGARSSPLHDDIVAPIDRVVAVLSHALDSARG